MHVAIIGSGAREHALLYKICQSPLVHKVSVLPGNPGMLHPNIFSTEKEVVLDSSSPLEYLKGCGTTDLLIVGPEAPLVDGWADESRALGIPTLGPGNMGAQLEGSKSFAKSFLQRHNIPTAAFEIFMDASAAKTYIAKAKRPLVLKADGLAAGKGVFVCKTTAEALEAVERIMVQKEFGTAGNTLIIEETLVGPEISFHFLCDGTSWFALPTAQDHKRLLDKDQGPNTGGMGAYSPTPLVTDALYTRIIEEVVKPTVKGLNRDSIPFRGVLFVGLMIQDGMPYVLEYNVRFGDPETTVILPRIKADVVPLLLSCANGTMTQLDTTPYDDLHPAALGVVLAAKGYPFAPEKGACIHIAKPTTHLFSAGVAEVNDKLVVSGGRVFCSVGVASTLAQASIEAHQQISDVTFEGMQYRRDIGHQVLGDHTQGDQVPHK